MESITINGSVVQLIKGDITRQTTDVIVSTANRLLMGGVGVDGAINKAGGPEIIEACDRIIKEKGQLKPGDVEVTTAGWLNAKCVFHAVGPVWRGGEANEEQQLNRVYENALETLVFLNLKSISFPNISTGNYSFPKGKAAQIAFKTAKQFLEQQELEQPIHINFVCFDFENYEIYKSLFGMHEMNT